MNESQTEFQAALATARHALEQYRAEPLVDSKRGGPRLSPWFRVWVQASEVAQRWHRQLDRDKPEPSIQDEIDRLLAGQAGQRKELDLYGKVSLNQGGKPEPMRLLGWL